MSTGVRAWQCHGRVVLCGVVVALTAQAGSRAQTADGKGPAQSLTQAGLTEAGVPSSQLYKEDTFIFPAPAPMAVIAGMQCDSSGNTYLIYGDTVATTLEGRSQLPIRRLSPESRTSTEFEMSAIPDYEFYYRHTFSVDPRGKVYALVVAWRRNSDREERKPPDYLVVKYKDDGGTDSIATLRGYPEARFSPGLLAPFTDGSLLLSGIAYPGPGGENRRAFAWIFNRAGVFQHDVTLPDDVTPEPARKDLGNNSSRPPAVPAAAQGGEVSRPPSHRPQASTEPRKIPWSVAVGDARAVSLANGNVCLLRASAPARLYEIGPSGDVVGHVQVEPPERGWQPEEMGMTGQGVVFVLFRPFTSVASRMVLSLIDPSTGKRVADYEISGETLGTFPGCPTPRNEFVFFGSTEDNRLTATKFVPR